MDFDTETVVTIIGWFITFILGIATVLIAQRISKKRKLLQWAVVDEFDLSPGAKEKNSTSNDDVEIKVLINGSEAMSQHNVSLKLLNAGNVELENVTVVLDFGVGAKVEHFRIVESLGVWEKHVHIEQSDQCLEITFDHINPAQNLPISIFVSDYTPSGVSADVLAP